MAQKNKKSLSYKLQKNPFLFVLLIAIVAVVLFAVINITDSLVEKKGNKTAETTTEAVATEPVALPEDNSIELKNVKKYDSSIVSVTAEKFADKILVKTVYSDKAALLKTHGVENDISLVVPVFCFYTNDGIQLKCPGELVLAEENATAVYSLSLIDDYKNAIALSDEITVDFDNILDNGFNIYLQHKTKKDAGTTVLGTYGKSVEDYNKTVTDSPAFSDITVGIRNIEMAKHDKFVWIDIYYDDADAYSKLNYNFDTNFVRFSFEKNGVTHERDFIISEYEELNMIRCKFDEYSLNELAEETGDNGKTVSDLFADYTITVSARDYKTEKSLFAMS